MCQVSSVDIDVHDQNVARDWLEESGSQNV